MNQNIPKNTLGIILMNLCNQNEEKALYVAKFLAFVLRTPDSRMETGLTFSGAGTGKTIFFNSLSFARHVKSWEALSLFNNWIDETDRLIVVDNVGEKYPAEELYQIKKYISSNELVINRKYKPTRTAPALQSFICLCQDDYPLSHHHRLQNFHANTPLRINELPSANDAAQFYDWLLNHLDLTGFTASSKYKPN